jgi:hypothetical protein
MFRNELKKMNNIKINDYTDYFLAHIMFDIEQVMNRCNITIKNTIRLINEGLVNIAEGVAGKRHLKQIVENDICGDRKLFGETNKFLGLINKRLDEWNNEETNIKKMALNFSLKRLDKTDILAYFPQHYYTCQLFRNFPSRDIRNLFDQEVNKMETHHKYPFLSYFNNVKEVLPVYKDIVYSHLDIVNYMNQEFNGKFSKEEARQITMSKLLADTGDTLLREKYTEF